MVKRNFKELMLFIKLGWSGILIGVRKIYDLRKKIEIVILSFLKRLFFGVNIIIFKDNSS